jgi:prepilin-type N-terminal cleavage/methylation domain-containing protein/prepilin-type processing-associated H-X9-DG protein
MSDHGDSQRFGRGFTLIELLLVIAIISVLISLLLPAIQSSRENARRLQCGKNLMQIGVAMANYASTHKVFPPGVINEKGPISNLPAGYHFGWAFQILPFLEHSAVHRQFNTAVSVYSPANDTARGHRLQIYMCPSSPSAAMSYAACHHDVEAPIDTTNHGVFYLNSRISYQDLTDGPAQTIFAGDINRNNASAGWAVGTMATLRNAGSPINIDDLVAAITPIAPSGYVFDAIHPKALEALIVEGKIPATYVGGYRSFHSGGANFLFGDGSVRFLKQRINQDVYRSLAHRADGNLISDDEY